MTASECTSFSFDLSKSRDLKAVTPLRLLADNVQHRIDQLSAFRVVTFCGISGQAPHKRDPASSWGIATATARRQTKLDQYHQFVKFNQMASCAASPLDT